jgi:hypothetical protein
MWLAWTQSQLAGTTPSAALRINAWATELTGLPGEDIWTCIQFDQAVRWFGIHIENKLQELDRRTYEPRYTLAGLLDDAQPDDNKVVNISKLKTMYGGMGDVVGTGLKRRQNPGG